MSEVEWWRGSVIYRFSPDRLCESDGAGNLPAITAKLDLLADLGVDAISLAPFFDSASQDFFDDLPAEHSAVDPASGTIEEFDGLLQRAHALGLRVLIDQVWGHTSDVHAWFQESRADRTNKRANWYIWADLARDDTPPNGDRSALGDAAWRWEPRRGQYFLHHLGSHLPALNLHNKAVLDALLAAAESWLRRGVDGFRLDAVNTLLRDRHLRNNDGAPLPTAYTSTAGAQPAAATAGLLARVRALAERYPGCVTLGEVGSEPGAFERVAAYTSGTALLHMAYTLRPFRGRLNWSTVQQFLRDAAASGDEGWFCWAFENDEAERALSRWKLPRDQAGAEPALTRLLLALSFSLRGSVSATAPWLPMPASSHGRLVDGPRPKEEALLGAVRRFLAWRRSQPALIHGALRPLSLPEPLVGFLREHKGHRILAAFNLSDVPATLSLTDYAAVRPLPECGFIMEIDDNAAILPGYGAFFARVIPAREWEEEAALAFA